MTKIKLCGMMAPEDILNAAALGADFVGFVFAPESRRYLEREQAAALKRMLPGTIPAVGVFVNEKPELVAELLAAGVIDMVQLHGSEDEAYIAALRKLTDRPLIKAFQLRRREDLKEAEKSSADMLLLDSGAGSGQTFEWSWLQEFHRPYFLAGGLSAENAGEALSQLHPYGVDVSSALESAGKKDPEKMKAFVEAVRRAGDI